MTDQISVEEQSLQIYENMEDAIWLQNLDGSQITYVNQAYETIWRKSRETLYDNPVSYLEAVHPEDRQRVEHKRALLQIQDIFEIHFRIVQPDGAVRWIHVRSFPIQNPTGEIVARTVMARDVTEQKEIEDELKRLNEELSQEHRLFVGGNVVIFKWRNEENWPVDYVSENVREFLGFNTDEFYEGSVRYGGIIHEDDIDRVFQEVQTSITSNANRINHQSYRLKKKSGEYIWVNDYTNILRDDNGMALFFHGYIQDITAHMETLNALGQSERLYRGIIETTAEGVWMIGPDRRTTDVNPALCEMLGYTKAEMLGKTPMDFVDEHNARIFREQTAQIDSTKQRSYRIELLTKNGEILPAMFHATTLSASQAGVRAIAFVTDLSEQIRDEKALAKANEELRELVDQKNVLLKEIHHRVKNNLQTIRSLLFKQMRDSSNQEVRSKLQDSMDRVSSIALIHEHIYRSDDIKAVRFQEYVKQFAETLIHTHHRAELIIDLSLDVEDIVTDLDRAIPVALILNELITNAMKYAFPGRSHGKISISFKREKNNTVLLSVTDDGKGLPDDFTPDTTESLGMFIVYNIGGRQLNGDVSYRSDGNGTSFHISIPEST